MKKILLLTALLGIMWGAAAQNTKPAWTTVSHVNFKGDNLSANTTLTITLHPIQAISVNTSDIRLTYNTVSDYTDGVKTGWIADHLKVFSTGGYSVNVNYEPIANNYMENYHEIFNQVIINIDGGASKNLSLTPVELIGSTKGDFNKYYRVNYTAGKNYAEFTRLKENRVVQATVTYTIVPK